MKNSTFLKDLFAIDKANDELFRLVGVAICMAIPLLIGYFSNNLLIGTFGSMGIYTFIYYQPLPLPQLLRRLNIVGFFIVLGNSLGMLSHHVPWLIPITIAIVAFLARLLFRLYGIEKPGALLVIMSTAMGTSNNFPLHKIPIMASFVLLGVVTGIIMGIVLHFIDKRPYVFQKRMSLQERLYIDPASLFRCFALCGHFIFSGLFKPIASFSQRLLDDVYLRSHFTRGKFTFCDAAKCATDSRYESWFVAFCNFINDSLYTFTNNRYH